MTALLLMVTASSYGQATQEAAEPWRKELSQRMKAFEQSPTDDSVRAQLMWAAQRAPKDQQLAARLVGTKAPEWQVKSWANSQPLQLKDLAGKVVLIRWFTEGCPFCSATAPALNSLYQQYHDQGLEVIGFYHHKSDLPLDVERVHRYAQQIKFNIPIAIDYEWKTLKNWWLDQSTFRWTSISILIDQQGNIQYVHPGGVYQEGDQEYKALHNKIEQLLAESKVGQQK
jgi:peroxiredoxin